MSDAKVREALERIEAWLADLDWTPDPGLLARWDADYRLALAEAKKGPGWADLITRAHAAGRQLEARTVVMEELRGQLREALEAHDRGGRALKGYGDSAR